MNSFSRSVDLLHRAMDVSTLRYQVSANNLANSEVPNFKRSVVNFESELKRAIESAENEKDSFKMITTDFMFLANVILMPIILNIYNCYDYFNNKFLNYTIGEMR